MQQTKVRMIIIKEGIALSGMLGKLSTIQHARKETKGWEGNKGEWWKEYKSKELLMQCDHEYKSKHRNMEEPYGNLFTANLIDSIRIYYQNINGINSKEDMYKYMKLIKIYEVDIWGWVETNINWMPELIEKFKSMG